MHGLLANKKGRLILSGDVNRNVAYDDIGVIELVSSGVARKGSMFGTIRKNFGIHSFTEKAWAVKLESLKVGWRFEFKTHLVSGCYPELISVK